MNKEEIISTIKNIFFALKNRSDVCTYDIDNNYYLFDDENVFGIKEGHKYLHVKGFMMPDILIYYTSARNNSFYFLELSDLSIKSLRQLPICLTDLIENKSEQRYKSSEMLRLNISLYFDMIIEPDMVNKSDKLNKVIQYRFKEPLKDYTEGDESNIYGFNSDKKIICGKEEIGLLYFNLEELQLIEAELKKLCE